MNSPHEPGKRIGKWFSISAWVIVLGFLTLFFNRTLDEQRNPNQRIEGSLTENGIKEIRLERNRAGHYVATGSINGHPVEFLVDTGATDVAIPAHLAEKLKLKTLRAIIYETANGPVRGFTTRIEKLSLGNVSVSQLRGGINPGMTNSYVLLGMSFLRQVEFTQRGDTLIIRQYPE